MGRQQHVHICHCGVCHAAVHGPVHTSVHLFAAICIVRFASVLLQGGVLVRAVQRAYW